MFSSEGVSEDEDPPLLDPLTETDEEDDKELELSRESLESSDEAWSWFKAEALSDSLSDKLSFSLYLSLILPFWLLKIIEAICNLFCYSSSTFIEDAVAISAHSV